MRFTTLCILRLLVCLAAPLAFSQSLMYNFVHLGFSGSGGVGINRWGDVVGDNNQNSTAFLYSRGNLSTISSPFSAAYGINDYLQVALYYNNHAYIYYPGTQPQSLGTLGGFMSAPFAINNSGMVVGQSTTPDNQYHPFLYSSGQMKDLGTLGASIPACSATGINNNGGIVGACMNSGGYQRAVRVVGGVVADMDARTTTYDSYASAINDNGDAVGWSNLGLCNLKTRVCRGSIQNAVIFKSSGTISSIGTLGGSVAYAMAINNSGDVVGQSTTTVGTHAFLFTHGSMRDLNTATLVNGSGWTLISANAINDNGQIVALGLSPTGSAETVILTPVPVLITSLTFSPASVVGGYSSTGIVTLSRPAPPGGVVIQLGSLNSAAQLPAGTSLTIPEGSSGGSFPVTTSVVFQQTFATIWARYSGITQNTILTINAYGI